MKKRSFKDMELSKLVLGVVSTNCYIIKNMNTKEAIIIDPGDEAATIKDYVESEGMDIKAILLTHGHFDHIMAVNELVNSYRVSVYASESEKRLLEDPNVNCSADIRKPYIVYCENLVKEEEILSIAGFKIKVIGTPGHTAGCVCYYFMEQQIMFSGDTIFLESVGRTDLPTGNERVLLQSIKEKLIPLDDKIEVFPGHGPDTTIGYEKRHNMYFQRI